MPEPRGRVRRSGRPSGRSGKGPVSRNERHAGRKQNAGIHSATTIDFVIDYSRSMRDILPTIYIFCRDLMNACQLGTGEVRFGITFFSDEVTRKTWKGEEFSSLPTDVLDGLLAHDIGGGARNRKENIGQAVRSSLDKLKQVPAGERVMIIFSDTPPQDASMVNCLDSVPVRSVLVFVPTGYSGAEYLFCLVDEKGRTDRSKTPFIFDIEEVIRSRYLKTEREQDGECRVDDNEDTRNQLLMALS